MEEVRSVLPRDAIPSIDDPVFGTSYFGDSTDEVIVVHGEQPRAYPIRILSYHEIVNDEVDGRPIAVTWCPICWSAVVFDRAVAGQTLTFGVSGKLADDALVMYDRETESEWKQPNGLAIGGELEGTQLAILPAPIVTWEQFTRAYPDGVVLQPVRGDDRSTRPSYDMSPYDQYAEGEDFGLHGMRGEGRRRSWDRDDLDAKTVVLGIEHGDHGVGYPKPWVETAGGVVIDTVGGLDVIVVAMEDGLHAFEHPGYEFEFRDGVLLADDATWDPVSGTSADGRELKRVPSRRLFAFAWQDAYGAESFYR